MSTWTTKSSGRDRNYIVLKHSLPHINNIIMGVKFRDGFAVVEKNSKIYCQLKRMPLLKNSREFPLEFLNELNFITRSSDVKLIYGVDVYNCYVKAITRSSNEKKILDKKEEERWHLEDSDKCHFRYLHGSNKGQLCRGMRLKESPSKYCLNHLLYDPKLNIGTTIPVTKTDRAKLALKIIKNIKSYIKNE